MQTITGNTVGMYTVTATVTIDETGASDQISTVVEVTDGSPVLQPLGSYPAAIPIGQQTDVLFTTIGSDFPDLPTEIVVEQVDASGNVIGQLGGLVDDGSAGDLRSFDSVYSGIFSIQSNAEGVLHFRSRAHFAGLLDPVYSKNTRLWVTRFPTDVGPGTGESVVVNPETGFSILTGEVMVSFVEGTDPDTIESMLNSVGGEVVGSLFAIGWYQVKVPDTGDATGIWSALEALIDRPEVASACPVILGSFFDFIPADPFFEPEQESLRQVRADDAWVVSGQDPVPMISIIDSGVDWNHPEFEYRVYAGQNYTEPAGGVNRWTPLDNMGHGTQVAGVAAAATNNGIGIAGVSGNSAILAVKFNNPSRSLRAKTKDCAAGIVYSAQVGAKIINVSAGFLDSSNNEYPVNAEYFACLRDAVEYAQERGCLIVGAAGNGDHNAPRAPNYPAAFSRVIGVGGTEMHSKGSPTRWVSDLATYGAQSQYGPFVDIAAPAIKIFSTWPTYDLPGWSVDFNCPQPMRDIEGCYSVGRGTSLASPLVAGAAALVWSVHPEWRAEHVRRQLLQTATEMPGEELGAGQVDVFEAVFNGSFEGEEYIPNSRRAAVETWQSYPYYGVLGDRFIHLPTTSFENASYGWHLVGYEKTPAWTIVDNNISPTLPINTDILYGVGGGFTEGYGPIEPVHGNTMAFITTGREGENKSWYYDGDPTDKMVYYATFLMRSFFIQPGIDQITVSYWYNMVTEEPNPYPYNTPPGDIFQFAVLFGGGNGEFSSISTTGLHLQGGLKPLVGFEEGGLQKFHTGWQYAKTDPIIIPEDLQQTGTAMQILFFLTDYPPMPGDSLGESLLRHELYDSYVFIDNVELAVEVE